MLGGTYGGGEAFTVGLQSHVMRGSAIVMDTETTTKMETMMEIVYERARH